MGLGTFKPVPCLGICSTCHTGEFVVHSEVILECDGGMSPVLPCNLDLLLGLDSLVETVGIASSSKDTAGELIYYLHLPGLHYIVHITVEQFVGFKSLGEVMDIFEVFVDEKRALYIFILEKEGFYLIHSIIGEDNMLGLLVQLIIPHQILFILRILAGLGILFAFIKIVA